MKYQAREVWKRLHLTWPLRFDIDHGLLDLPRHFLLRRPRFQLHSRFVTCRPLQFPRVGSRKSLIVNVWHFPLPRLSRHSAVLHLYLWMSFTTFLNNSRLLSSLSNLALSQSWQRHHSFGIFHHFFDSEPLSLFTLWRHDNTLTIQLAIRDYTASESSDHHLLNIDCQALLPNCFHPRSSWSRRTPPQSLNSWGLCWLVFKSTAISPFDWTDRT